MFAADYEPVVSDDRRRAQRASVSLEARAEHDGLTRALCRVVDVSTTGCRLQTYSALRRGAVILLNLPEIGPVEAEITWAGDFLAGCHFRSPLAQAALEAMVAGRGAAVG